jgi:hypothetical protein
MVTIMLKNFPREWFIKMTVLLRDRFYSNYSSSLSEPNRRIGLDREVRSGWRNIPLTLRADGCGLAVCLIAGISGSNSAEGMDVRLLCLLCVV